MASKSSVFGRTIKLWKKKEKGSGDPNSSTLADPLIVQQDVGGSADHDLGNVADNTPAGPLKTDRNHASFPDDVLERMSVNLPQLPAQLFNETVFSELDNDHRYIMACDYINDAIHNRNLQVVPTDHKQKLALKIVTNWAYDGLIVSIIIFHMVLAVWEDPTDSKNDSPTIVWIDFALDAFYGLDIFLGIIALGWGRFLTKKWNQVRCLIVAFMLFGDNPYARPLRSALLISRVVSLRHTMNSMAKSIPKAVEVFVLFGVTIAFYASLGVVCFNGQYSNLDDEFTGSFDSFGRAALAMFVLSTTENYPMIMYPAQAFSPVFATIFFVSYIMIMVYVILQLFQAALYKTWSEELEAQQVKTRVRRYHSLLAAYQVLLDDGDKMMSLSMWEEIVKIIRPDMDENGAKLTFLMMDTGETGEINLKKFLGGAVEALKYDFNDIRREMKVTEAVKAGNVILGKKVRSFLKKLMRKQVWRVGIYVVVVVHSVLLAFAPYPNTDLTYSALFNVLLFCSFVEMVCKLIAYPYVRYWKPFSRFDLFIIFVSIVTEWVFPLVDLKHAGIWGRTTQCIRVLRLLSLSRRMRQLTTTVAGVRVMIVRFFMVFALTIYSFSGIALLIFDGNIPEDFDPNSDDDLDVLDPHAQLNTIVQAVLALFQIAVTNNWQDIMFLNCVKGLKVGIWGSVFFICYFMVVVWFGTNIMGAVIIEAYVTAVDRRDKEVKEEMEEMIKRRRNSSNITKGGDRTRRKNSGFTGDPNVRGRKGSTTKKKGSIGSIGSVGSLGSVEDVSGDRIGQEFMKRIIKKSAKNHSERGVASEDLKNEEVLGMLQQEVDKTHASVRRNSLKINERLSSFRDINSQGGGGGKK